MWWRNLCVLCINAQVGDEHRGYLLELLLTKLRYSTATMDSQVWHSMSHNGTDHPHALPAPEDTCLGHAEIGILPCLTPACELIARQCICLT